VRDTGARPGKAVPQVYVSPRQGGWEAPKRLGGWAKLSLQPGEPRRVSLEIDPRLLAVWDEQAHDWRVAGGDYDVLLSTSARDVKQRVSVRLPSMQLPAGARSPCAWSRRPGVVTSCAPPARP
jgi:beta-glucosidase